MILDWLMFAGGALGTLALGLPVVRAVVRREWTHAVARDPSTRKARTDVPRAYTPLDLGIDPVRWPSDRLWALQSTLEVPDWPSRSWDDEHFGRHWKDQPVVDASEAGFHAMALRRHREEVHGGTSPPTVRPARTRDAAKKSPAKNKNGGKDAPGKAAPGKAAPGKAAPGKAAPGKAAQERVLAAVTPASPAPSAVDPPTARAAPPDAAELEHLIATVGLAGTVQAIMQKTGWEFREAAQYLARIRSNP